MKEVKLKFFYEVTKTLTALLLGVGGAIVALLTNDGVAIPNMTLLMFALIVLMTVLGLALVLIFLLIFNKIK